MRGRTLNNTRAPIERVSKMHRSRVVSLDDLCVLYPAKSSHLKSIISFSSAKLLSFLPFFQLCSFILHSPSLPSAAHPTATGSSCRSLIFGKQNDISDPDRSSQAVLFRTWSSRHRYIVETDRREATAVPPPVAKHVRPIATRRDSLHHF